MWLEGRNENRVMKKGKRREGREEYDKGEGREEERTEARGSKRSGRRKNEGEIVVGGRK